MNEFPHFIKAAKKVIAINKDKKEEVKNNKLA
jgi:hypothetical protein